MRTCYTMGQHEASDQSEVDLPEPEPSQEAVRVHDSVPFLLALGQV